MHLTERLERKCQWQAQEGVLSVSNYQIKRINSEKRITSLPASSPHLKKECFPTSLDYKWQ